MYSNVPSNAEIVAVYHDWAIIKKVFSYSRNSADGVGTTRHFHLGEHPGHEGDCEWVDNSPERLRCKMCKKEMPPKTRENLRIIKAILKPETRKG